MLGSTGPTWLQQQGDAEFDDVAHLAHLWGAELLIDVPDLDWQREGNAGCSHKRHLQGQQCCATWPEAAMTLMQCRGCASPGLKCSL